MKISVITPVFNRQDCIKNCLDSVSAQSGFECEIEHVVVNDGSKDATLDIITDYAKTHPHVKVVNFPVNRGTNAGRNAAVAAATGDYVVILDSDDIMIPGAISTMAETINANPEFEYFMFTRDDCKDYCNQFGDSKVFTLRDFLDGKAKGDFVHCMRREIMFNNPFDEEIRVYEGVFFLRFYRQVGKMLFTNKAIYHVDRGRTDHVTFTLNKTSDDVLRKDCIACNYQFVWFANDYTQTPEGKNRLANILCNSFRNNVMLGRYNDASKDLNHLQSINSTPQFI